MPKDEDWSPPVAVDEMRDPAQAGKDKHGKAELQVKFCLVFAPIRHPDGHKEEDYFWK